MAFYRELANRPHRSRLVVMGNQSQTILEDYVASNALHVDGVVSAQGADVALAATPRIVLIDPDRKILSIWKGQLPSGSQEEQQVLASVAR